MRFSALKEYLDEFWNYVRSTLSQVKNKLENLEENNIDLAIDYFEYGILNECKSRLKIILRLWPNDNYAKYLLGLVYMLYREDEKALKYLKDVNGEKQKYAEKLINIINFNKTEKVIDIYKINQELFKLESAIDNVKL